MAAGFRVMTWDVRSHGQSRPGVFKLSTALDDLLAILDVMKVDQATFVGHSMGGNLHQELVFRHPERVRALVMLDCTWNFQKLSRLEAFSVKIGIPMIGWYPYDTLINQMANLVVSRPADRAYMREAFSILTKPEFVAIMAETSLCLHNEPDYYIPKPMLLMVATRMPPEIFARWLRCGLPMSGSVPMWSSPMLCMEPIWIIRSSSTRPCWIFCRSRQGRSAQLFR